MTNKNRIITFLIVVSMLFVFPGAALGQKADFVSDNAYDLLTRLGIEVTNDNTQLTRIEFATLILQLTKQLGEGEAIPESYFYDVQGVSAGVVNSAVDLGYFKKSANGMFRPNDNITFEEAVVVCVRVLGYEYTAGEPYSFAKYFNIANRNKLLDGVDTADFDSVSLNVLLVNTLNATCADTVYAENKIQLPETTLIESLYGIAHYVGRVDAVNGVSVTGSDIADYGRVIIDGVTYATDEAYATEDFLGSTVDCYLTNQNGSSRLFAMYRYEEGRYLELDGEDIASVANDLSYIRYYAGNSAKNAKLDSGISVIYNNTKKFNVSKKDFEGENVRITLTDSDSNGVYETAVISNPRYYKVAAVDVEDMYVGSYNNMPPLELGQLASDNLLEIVNTDGTYASLSDIKKGTYIEVLNSVNSVGAIDYSKNVRIVILSGTVSGAVESVDYDNNSVTVNGTEYGYVSDIADEIAPGKGLIFYIGTNGKLIGISDILPDSNTYGYLVGVKKDGTLSDNVMAKIFGQNGKMAVYTTGRKINYTGYIGTDYVENMTVDSDELIGYITEGQLVKYYADGNNILQKLVCAYDYSSDSDYEGNDDSKFTLEYHNPKGRFYNVVASENHYYDTKSLIFSIPENGVDRDYSVGPYTAYPELNGVDIRLYDSSASFICKVGVMVTSSTLAAEFTDEELGDQNIAVISKKTKKIMGEEEVIALKAYCKSKEVTLVAKRDDLHDATVAVPSQGEKSTIYFNELNPGDVIQYKDDGNGMVTLINVLHRFDKNNLSSRYYTLQPDMAHLSLMITQSGLVEKYKPDGFFTVTDSNGKKYNFSDTRIMYHIYIYDIATGDVEVVNPLTYLNEAGSANPDYVFVKCRRTSLRDLVVYRNR